MEKLKISFPLLLGIISTLISNVICVLVIMNTGFFFQSCSIFFIIPVGGMIVGALCTCGLFLGLRIANIRVERMHYILSIILAIVGFVGTYFVLYIFIIAKYDIYMDFNKFVNSFVLNRSSTFKVGGIISKPYKMGLAYNIIKTVIEGIGFIIGGLTISLFILENTRFCDKCRIYMKNKNMYSVRADNPEKLFNELNNSILSESILCDYIIKSKKDSKYERKMAHKYKSAYFNIGLLYCNNCFDGFLVIKLMKKSGHTYEEVKKVRQLIIIDINNVKGLLNVI